mmetsp:Transcript_29004/g.72804  ORF Transcript_29004/g.72804 Transcript_29004/m.72804 type:complete len:376 (-) Transcript_29004:601-1728(-)
MASPFRALSCSPGTGSTKPSMRGPARPRAGGPACPALTAAPLPRRASPATPHPRRMPRRPAGAVVVGAGAGASSAAAEPTRLGSPQWDEFAAAAGGEWEGVTSTFGPDGAVRQLPEYYVPDAYKEWGVEVVDWTHMTSTLATAEGLSNSVKKFMPTVGCEADAVAFVEESHQALKAPDGRGGEAKTISPEGSYSLGPRVLGADGGNGFEKHRVEACLAGPDKERVRVVYTVQRRDGGSPWKVFALDVFKEMYVGEYEGGTDLRACGGPDGYGQKPRTEAEALCGTWHRESARGYACNDSQEFVACEVEAPPERQVEEDGLVALPLGVWSRFSSEGPEDFAVESGWMFAEGRQRVVSRSYRSNALTSITIAEERKQ